MAIFFSPSEIFQFAIKIEENGEAFYRKMSNKFKDSQTKELFLYLADEETKHKQKFKEMLSEIEDYQPPQSYPEEYFLYLKSYADEHIFSQEKTAYFMSEEKIAPKKIIEFALDIEKDSILYYLEAKNLVSPSQKDKLDKIIEEERKHYLKLLEVKKKW